MPSYIITMKQDAPDTEVQKVKDDIKNQGGTIKHEYSLIKGFAAEFPEGHYSTLSTHPHVDNIETDGVVKTQ